MPRRSRRDWARVLDYYLANPITAGGGTNIAYETHVYNPTEEFKVLFEDPSLNLPVIFGEFAPQRDPNSPLMTLGDCEALMTSARREDVMEGVPELLHEVQVEATFPDGTKLVMLHQPIP